MGKKTIKVQYSRAEHLRTITRKLLITIEDRIERLNIAKNDEIIHLKKTHDLLFGNKLSIVGNLVLLVDLLVKMGDDMTDNSICILNENSTSDLAVHDIKLIKDFVKKQKSDEAKV